MTQNKEVCNKSSHSKFITHFKSKKSKFLYTDMSENLKFHILIKIAFYTFLGCFFKLLILQLKC